MSSNANWPSLPEKTARPRSRPGAMIDSAYNWVADLGKRVIEWMAGLGDVALFSVATLGWLFRRRPQRETIWWNFYQIGVLSLPVVALTGTFIGMVLAVQTYTQFERMGMATRMGAVINMALVRELGPVLAATMLAGRVGSAMAAELGTMRVTEQIDALTSMGANPIHYLVVPRFLACLVLIPSLTVMADFMGVIGGCLYSVYVFQIDWYHYLHHSAEYVETYDFLAGVVKSLFFGAAIALIACYQGFHCDPGAEGVGRASTSSFVYSFVVILLLDLVLGVATVGVYNAFWPPRRLMG